MNMFNLSEQQLRQLTDDRRKDLMRHAQQRRLAQSVHSDTPSVREAALAMLGSALVTLGRRLQAAGKRESIRHTV